jgi:iodotyrosine deiodinase
MSSEVSPYRPVPLVFQRRDPAEMVRRAREFADTMSARRTVRDFSPEPFPDEILTEAIRAAGTAPSGAHQQPWTFVVVRDPALKQQIRAAAEEEERKSYEGRMSAEWLAALAPLGVDWQKPHLTEAPALIVVFSQPWGLRDEEAGPARIKHYYVDESVGIAVGLLLAGLHHGGLATLTHTPSPMGFLRELLGRPANERAYVVIPVGYPAPDAVVPDLQRKPLAEVMIER